MNSHLKILLFLDSHISMTLTKIKLEKNGHAVSSVESFSDLQDEVKVHFYDVVIVDLPWDKSKEIYPATLKQKSPVLFLDTGNCIPPTDSNLVLGSTFTEEEFLAKFQYGLKIQQQKDKQDMSLHEIIMSHYAGDKNLAQKICKAFLEGYEKHLAIIEDAFKSGEDVDLAKKIHAFKGALSALGETPAAKLLRKIEILVKGRQRQVAMQMLEQLFKFCSELAQEASDLVES